MNTGTHVVLYGLVAATSPLALGATLVVLRSRHGRLNGLAFAIGVLAGQSLVCLLLLELGTTWVPGGGAEHERLRGILDVVFGVVLLVAAWQIGTRGTPLRSAPAAPGPRARAWYAWRARLEQVGPVTALWAGALLGVGGPKRLGITFLATTEVGAADLSRNQTLILMVVYVLLGTALVWAPVLAYLVFADRAAAWLERRQEWIRDHQRSLVLYPSLVLGVVLVVNGMVELLSAA